MGETRIVIIRRGEEKKKEEVWFYYDQILRRHVGWSSRGELLKITPQEFWEHRSLDASPIEIELDV